MTKKSYFLLTRSHHLANLCKTITTLDIGLMNKVHTFRVYSMVPMKDAPFESGYPFIYSLYATFSFTFVRCGKTVRIWYSCWPFIQKNYISYVLIRTMSKYEVDGIRMKYHIVALKW